MRDIEHASFTPLVIGGLGTAATVRVTYKRLGSLLSSKPCHGLAEMSSLLFPIAILHHVYQGCSVSSGHDASCPSAEIDVISWKAQLLG